MAGQNPKLGHHGFNELPEAAAHHVNPVGKLPEKVAVAPDALAHLGFEAGNERREVALVGPEQRQPLRQRLLKPDFAGHAPVGKGPDLGHHGGLVGVPLQGNIGQLIEAFDLGEGGVEVENKVGQEGSGVGHDNKDACGSTLSGHWLPKYFMKQVLLLPLALLFETPAVGPAPVRVTFSPLNS